MRVALIDAEASTRPGHIAVELCRQVAERGHRALFCHSRGYCPQDVPSYRISCWMGQNLTLGRRSKSRLNGRAELKKAVHPHRDSMGSAVSRYLHLLLARLTDRQGFFSKYATRRLVDQLKLFQPDVIHLHNLHGYYLHLPTLFDYLKKENLPVVWTLHDLWAFTGHCLYPSMAEDPAPSLEQENILDSGDPEGAAYVERQLCTEGCQRWLSGCGECAQKREYPESWLRDQSARNWREKRSLFTSLQYLILATPSEWLKSQVQRSFLKNYPTYCLPHGVDPGVFKPCVSETERYSVLKRMKLHTCLDKHLLLSVAGIWEPRKGLEDLLALAEKLGDSYCIVAVGLEDEQRAAIPDGTIITLPEMGNLQDLCALYTAADLFVSMSHAESMGTRLLQALSCGTQVFSWDTTALPEIVTPEVGAMAPLGDLDAAAEAIRQLCDDPRSPEDCRRRALEFDAGTRLHEYIRLYERMHINGPRATVSEKVAAGC